MDLIYTHFKDKEVSDVDIIKARTKENKSFQIFCMKNPDYVTKIMEIWMTLDKLEGAKTGIEFTDRSGTNKTKLFTYRHTLEYILSIYIKYMTTTTV